MTAKPQFRFDFAISYAGEESGIAGDLACLLREHGAKVFFATSEKVYLLGKRLTSELKHVFGPHTRFFVPIITNHYVQKYWPAYEFRIAQIEESKRPFEYMLPIRLDDAVLQGLETDRGYIDLRKEGLFGAASTLTEKLHEYYPAEERDVPQIWTATFGVRVEDLAAAPELPSSAPQGYPHLCDWLEKELIRRLSGSALEDITLLEDSRTGETLSVRVGFRWDPQRGPLDLGDPGWWEVLEVAPFESVYPGENWERLPRTPNK